MLLRYKPGRSWFNSIILIRLAINRFIKKICHIKSTPRGTIIILTSWWVSKIKINNFRQKTEHITCPWFVTSLRIKSFSKTPRNIPASKWERATTIRCLKARILSSSKWECLFKNIQNLKILHKNYRIVVNPKPNKPCWSNKILKAHLKSKKFNSNNSHSWIINRALLTKCCLLKRMWKIKCWFTINSRSRIRLNNSNNRPLSKKCHLNLK